MGVVKLVTYIQYSSPVSRSIAAVPMCEALGTSTSLLTHLPLTRRTSTTRLFTLSRTSRINMSLAIE